MTAHAITPSRRRGACPGLSAPMSTGDGLLVRLMAIGTVPLAAFADLCAAARAHGNGVIEITSRGSIQARGLSAGSAPQFATAVATLGIAAEDGVPVHCNALAGLDAAEIFDTAALAAGLRHALTRRAMAEKLGAKVSIAIDGGGVLDLSGLAADIRVCAQVTNGAVALRVGIGGDDASAADLGFVGPEHGFETVMRLLGILAQFGRQARARTLLATEGTAIFQSAIADLLIPARPGDSRNRRKRASGETIGQHRLRDGSLACGIGLSFGHADAAALERLVEAAAIADAGGLRAAPGRALLAIGLKPETTVEFTAAAAQLGFIVRADDPCRHVVACPGAPICASAHIATRTLAPRLAVSATPYLCGDFTIHLSGCAKGCALSAPATLTVVGTPDGCALIARGSTHDTPFGIVAADDLPAAIATYARAQNFEVHDV